MGILSFLKGKSPEFELRVVEKGPSTFMYRIIEFDSVSASTIAWAIIIHHDKAPSFSNKFEESKRNKLNHSLEIAKVSVAYGCNKKTEAQVIKLIVDRAQQDSKTHKCNSTWFLKNKDTKKLMLFGNLFLPWNHNSFYVRLRKATSADAKWQGKVAA
jgi:hypothetical protein